MLRFVALILLPVALLAAACGSSGGNSDSASDGAGEVSSGAGPDGIYNTADDLVDGEPAIDDDAAIDDDDAIVGDTDSSDDSSGVDFGVGDTSLGDSTVLGALNPFSFLTGAGPEAFAVGQGTVDPDLGSALLTLGDLPASYQDLGEFTAAVPTEYGDISMSARMFGTTADPEDVGAMVMSAAMTLPAEAQGELDELTGLSEGDLADLQAEMGEFSEQFNIELLNADGLGSEGFGAHMEIDFGALLEAFGAPDDDSVPTGIAMDMYAFEDGGRVLMLMVMWPSGMSSGVDSRALAEVMDSRA